MKKDFKSLLKEFMIKKNRLNESDESIEDYNKKYGRTSAEISNIKAEHDKYFKEPERTNELIDYNGSGYFNDIFTFGNGKNLQQAQYWRKIFLDEVIIPNINDNWIKEVSAEQFKKAYKGKEGGPRFLKSIDLSSENTDMFLYVFDRGYWYFATLENGGESEGDVTNDWKYYFIPYDFIVQPFIYRVYDFIKNNTDRFGIISYDKKED